MNPTWTRTKIVATLGPAVSELAVLKKLILNGLDLARLNFSHGDHPTHLENIRKIRCLEKKLGLSIGILQDLPGPKLRVTSVFDEELKLDPNDEVCLSNSIQKRRPKTIAIPLQTLVKDLEVGHPVFIADGTIKLTVTSVKDPEILCRVILGGTVRKGNGVNLPQSKLSLKAFTGADKKHLAFGIKNGVDFVGISFVGTGDDVKHVRSFCVKRGKNPFLIAKIERQEAINNLDDIIGASDGIMVARGDLGVEIPFAEIPTVQREIVRRAHRQGRPVIVATQVLESMVQQPKPTRAEATDIATAITEGADAIMLSGETSIGKYPVEAVKTLNEVIAATEKGLVNTPCEQMVPALNHQEIFVEEACHLAERVGAQLIVVPSRSGQTAMRVSKFRPRLPILAMTNSPEVKRKLSLSYGVIAIGNNRNLAEGKLAATVKKTLLKTRWAAKKNRVLVITGQGGDSPGDTGHIQILEL